MKKTMPQDMCFENQFLSLKKPKINRGHFGPDEIVPGHCLNECHYNLSFVPKPPTPDYYKPTKIRVLILFWAILDNERYPVCTLI